MIKQIMPTIYSRPCGYTIAIADLTEVPKEWASDCWGKPLDGLIFIINRINVPAKYRGTGLGRSLLKEICDDADEIDATLCLTINPYGEMDYDQLAAWYKRYGFEGNDQGFYVRMSDVKPFWLKY